jgi:hypothetical protein
MVLITVPTIGTGRVSYYVPAPIERKLQRKMLGLCAVTSVAGHPGRQKCVTLCSSAILTLAMAVLFVVERIFYDCTERAIGGGDIREAYGRRSPYHLGFS